MPTIPDLLLGADPAGREALLRSLPEHRLRAVARAFGEWAHGGQLAPPGNWRTWVLMAGRGFGKTRAGAEWVLGAVRAAAVEKLRIALVGATVDEARAVMVEGESGLIACARPGEIADWSPARRELRFSCGALAVLFSGANPQGLRGPQHHLAWCDELAKWRHPQAAWDMLQLGLRLAGPAAGPGPRALVTTTPRDGCAALKRILAAADTVCTGGPTGANPHLPPAFLAAIDGAYGGTRLARVEIDGVLLDDVAGSLWPAALLESSRGPAPAPGELRRVVVGVDPPASAQGTCGIVVCGLDGAGVGHVLADRSAGGLSPEGWARAVAAAAEAFGADRIVAESNQGGDMVGAVLRAAGIALPITPACATRGKGARAEPVAGLFESGKARLAGRFPELEAQLGGLVPAGYAVPGASPDRADAMVWALWALLVAPTAPPRVLMT
jgi:phage terminase large subunit-like protein